MHAIESMPIAAGQPTPPPGPECWLCGGVLVFMLILGILRGRPKRCDVCGVTIRRKYYEWKTSEGKMKLCPKCNNRMESRKSSRAFRDRFGD